MDAGTGKRRWTFPSGGVGASAPAVSGDVVYIGSNAKRMCAVDAGTGRQRWQLPTGGRVFSSPVVADGVVFVGSENGDLYAVTA
ncbi:PQQ-binding-like beta-propeller repeat protein [Streptomyces sp. NPDC051677]|uniref:outer membrane protein assembly factor BamB family protein n=1 Tax=Streptomyces sp. NPDC051677 TaxID=3365669 RepID=UPI0037D82C40